MAVELSYKIGWVLNAGGVSCSNPPVNSQVEVTVGGGAYGSGYNNKAYNSAIMNAENNYTYDMCLLFDRPTTVRYYYGGGEDDHDDYQAYYDDVSGYYYYCRGGYAGYILQWTQLTGLVPYFETINDFCTYVGTPQEPPYNWQSVPSISGKNGILQALSTLVNINDGNPVSGASASAVNIIPASVVSGMIQTGASDVIVSFEIPQLTSGTYDSITLVGKRGGIPKDKTDGESITTLTDTDISKTITGLAQNVKYWFVIFTEDSKGGTSESEPYDFIIGDNPLPYVRQGYKTDNSPELYWATYKNISIDSPSVVGKDEWKAYIVVIHRQTITLPSGWTLLDKQVNKSGWQYVSIYSKVVTQSETVRVSQTSENALAVMSFYTDKDNTVVYEDDYYGDTSNPMKWVIPPSTEPRIFVFSLGYTVEVYGTNSVVYSPSLNGWQTPAIYSTTNNYRAMMFYMTGEETSDTTVTYNGFAATGQWAEDKLNSSQICSYKVIYQKEQ